MIPIKSRGPPMRHATQHPGLFIKTNHGTTKSVSGWGMQPCLKWCKGNKFLSVFVISTCFCDFYLCFVISTYASQINTIKPPRAIYIDSSHFLTKTLKFTKHDLRFLPHYQVSKRYKELIDSHPINVNQTEWEELVDHILESKKGQVDRMTKYKK